jgi:hypothetical protein
MHISKELPDSLFLVHEDLEWIQPVDYEHVSFCCRKCHEHGHLYRDCTKKKLVIDLKQLEATNEDGFKKVTNKRHKNRKPLAAEKPTSTPTNNSFEALVD